MLRKNICTRVNAELWGAFKVEAIRQGRTVGALLSEALQDKISGSLNKKNKPLNKELKPLNKPEKQENKKTENKPIKQPTSRAPVSTINKHFNSTVINKTINKLTLNNNKPRISADKPKKAYLSIQEAYNEIAETQSKADHLPGFRLCKRLSDKRKTGIDRLLKELAGTEITPSDYFALCCLNRHWRGDNDRRWRADLEFLTRDEIISRALELEQTDSEQAKTITSADFFPEESPIIDITTDQRGQPWQLMKH